MAKCFRSTSIRFYLWSILISLPALCLASGTLSSVVLGMPDDAAGEIVPEQPILPESQTDMDPNSFQADPNTYQGDPNATKEKAIDIGNGIVMDFVLIPAGEFDMGSPSMERDRDNDEGPVHRVRISKPFYMGKYEVTQEQYYAIAKSKPSRFKHDNRPVDSVSWKQADGFCKELSDVKDGSFRLPTEAEWEYSCRAGSQGRFCFGDDPMYSQIGDYAWCSENSDSTTHPVGEKKPNSFGLYDMHGNVWEWCGDWYADDYYQHSLTVDPYGPLKGKSRVLRGGGWFRSARYCRSANRSGLEPYYIRNHIGFRVVMEME